MKADAATTAASQQELKQAQAAMELAKLEAESRKPSAALQAEIDRTQQLMTMRNEVLVLLGEQMGEGKTGASFSDYLGGLARQAREGLWLTGFAVGSGGTGMVLRGRMLDKSLLPDYVRRLNAEPAFAGRTFAGMNVEVRDVALAAVSPAPGSAGSASGVAAGGAGRFLEFQLTADVAAAGEKKP